MVLLVVFQFVLNEKLFGLEFNFLRTLEREIGAHLRPQTLLPFRGGFFVGSDLYVHFLSAVEIVFDVAEHLPERTEFLFEFGQRNRLVFIVVMAICVVVPHYKRVFAN